MKAKQLITKLGSIPPNAEILIDMDGVWKPLGKVELGVLTDNRTKRQDHVVRLRAKGTR